ncbi:hypothetical protein ACFYYN_36095 [Streptomyces sp. NPDC001902]
MSKSSQSAPVGVILAVDPDRFADVLIGLRQAGLTVTSEQRILGTLTGTIAENRIPALEAIDGVESLDQEHATELPPPQSPIQ